MMKRPLMVPALAAVLSLQSGFVSAVEPTPVQEKAQTQVQEHIYGNQLMTQQERIAYRVEMNNAKNDKEQKQIRQKHYNAMRIRARARGVMLPDEPPARGGNRMGSGDGRGR